MAEKKTEKKAEIKPIVMTDTLSNKKYTLEFSRETVRIAEENGFKPSRLDEFSLSGTEDLFYYSFLMHHPDMEFEDAMKILYEQLHGLPTEVLARLGELYYATVDALVQHEEDAKNARMAIVL